MSAKELPIIPLCKNVHTWGSFRPMPHQRPDGTTISIRMCPHCTMTMEAFAKLKTPDRRRAR